MTEQALKTEIASLRAHVAGLENQLNAECKHEWRQLWDYEPELFAYPTSDFFCVHCRVVRCREAR